jgi:proteasome lid subunit RPN8/RPN11
MSGHGFQIVSVHQDAPFREREAFEDYQAFRNPDMAILVAPGTARDLRTAAERARPHETGGLLSGRTLRDAEGQYVLVSGYVEASAEAGRAAAFEISPQATAQLRKAAFQRDPTADVVGWWHSHLGPSSYSPVDRNTQQIFRQPTSVGLLVFASGEPWARAYVGPEATLLSDPVSARTRHQVQDVLGHPPGEHASDTSVNGADDGQDRSPRTIPGPARVTRWRPTPSSRGPVRLLVLVIVALLILILMTIIELFAIQATSSRAVSALQEAASAVAGQQILSGEISSGQRQLSRQIAETASPSDAPSIVAWCIPALTADGTYTGSLDCAAATSGAPGTVTWQLDGTAVANGFRTTIRLPFTHHPHQLRALLRTGAGAMYSSATQSITL